MAMTSSSSDACGLIPGPSAMPDNVRAAYSASLGSPDTDPAFWDDYLALERALQSLLRTTNSIAIQSGEGMVALWGALRSTIRAGDTVVCAVNGVFGDGFAFMARGMGANVVVVESDWRHPVNVEQLSAAIKTHDPKLVTIVHCETPSGMLNSLEGIGAAVSAHTTDGLLLVDFVSSACGAPLDVDALQIDLGLLAPQKVLSGPAALGMTSISDKAWKRINAIGYVGYDALQPFYRVAETEPRLMPYTHNWHAVRATLQACRNILDHGGLEQSWSRHAEVAQFCRDLVRNELKLSLYIENDAVAATTVTAVELPASVSWAALNRELCANSVFVGGSYGPLYGKVFRLGHMGTQADKALVARAVAAIGTAIEKLTKVE
jgi:aspartate aminotransferase-like enzyme